MLYPAQRYGGHETFGRDGLKTPDREEFLFDIKRRLERFKEPQKHKKLLNCNNKDESFHFDILLSFFSVNFGRQMPLKQNFCPTCFHGIFGQ